MASPRERVAFTALECLEGVGEGPAWTRVRRLSSREVAGKKIVSFVSPVLVVASISFRDMLCELA